MLGKDEIELRARLGAIEYLLTRLYEGQLATHPSPEAALAQMREGWLRGLESETIPGVDPGVSDHMTAEVRDAIARLLDMVGEFLQSRRQRK